MKKWKIADIEIDNQVVLAPMAGVCNSAFRTIVKEQGAGLIYTEMVSDKAIFYGNKKTLDMMDIDPNEHPVAMQVFGSDIETFVHAAKYIDENIDCDIIDINMGCPVPKVAMRAQAGAALMKDPEKVYEIVKAISDAVKKPVTVKMRMGWDSDSINAVEVAKKNVKKLERKQLLYTAVLENKCMKVKRIGRL
jgi:nifR3 family TIM-barrel protein